MHIGAHTIQRQRKAFQWIDADTFPSNAVPYLPLQSRGNAVDRNGGRGKVIIFATGALGYLMQGSGAGRNKGVRKGERCFG